MTHDDSEVFPIPDMPLSTKVKTVNAIFFNTIFCSQAFSLPVLCFEALGSMIPLIKSDWKESICPTYEEKEIVTELCVRRDG